MYRRVGGCVHTYRLTSPKKNNSGPFFFSSCRIFLVPFSSYSYYSLSYLSFVLWLFFSLQLCVVCVAARKKDESMLLVGWKARFRHSQLASGPVICHSSAIDDSLSSVFCCLSFFVPLLLLLFFSDINKTESLRGDASQRPKESSKDRSSLVNEAILTAKDLLALRNI